MYTSILDNDELLDDFIRYTMTVRVTANTAHIRTTTNFKEKC